MPITITPQPARTATAITCLRTRTVASGGRVVRTKIFRSVTPDKLLISQIRLDNIRCSLHRGQSGQPSALRARCDRRWEIRVSKIASMIGDCDWGIHDLSRVAPGFRHIDDLSTPSLRGLIRGNRARSRHCCNPKTRACQERDLGHTARRHLTLP